MKYHTKQNQIRFIHQALGKLFKTLSFLHLKVEWTFCTLLLGLLLSSVPAEARNFHLRFDKLDISHGLSQSTITAIFQDSEGFLWFGTQDGLNRYDGYSFVIYKHNPADSTSISDIWITSIAEDSSGNLWIGTAGGGLNKLDKMTNKFIRHRSNPGHANSLSSDRVTSTFVDSDDIVWIGTADAGVNKFDPRYNSFTTFKADMANQNSVSSNKIVSILEDSEQQLWIATADCGLNRFDRKMGTFEHYKHNPSDPHSLGSDQLNILYLNAQKQLWIGTQKGLSFLDQQSSRFINYPIQSIDERIVLDSNVRAILEDEEKTLWIGTDGGIHLKFEGDNFFYTHQHNSRDAESLTENHIYAMFEDRSGIIWIGTYGGGLNKYDREKNIFAHFKQDPLDEQSVSDNNVWSFFEDEQGIVWIGTNNGLNRYDPQRNTFRHYLADPGQPGSLSHHVIRAIWVDQSGHVWCGTDGGGLNRFDQKTQKFTVYKHSEGDQNSLSDDIIRALYEDEHHILWIATWNGLDALNIKTDQFTHYRHDPSNPKSISDNRVRSLFEDKAGNLWIGTYGGLNLFDKKTQSFKSYTHDPQNQQSLSNDRVLCIHEDDANNLWIGTFQGLNLFAPENNKFMRLTAKDGLPNEVIYGIVEDEAGKLWVSTNNGLASYDPLHSQLEAFKHYDVYDGLQSNEFNGGAYLKSRTGAIYFGGINGFNKFFPGKVRENDHIPNIVITAFKKFDKIISLEQSLSKIKQIDLTYRDNFFAFEFAALDFTNPHKNQYAYKLEGFDENWIECGNRRYASYTNLDGGSYEFKVRGSNNDGIWNNKGASVKIIITPPFWKAWWFRIFGGMMLLLAGYLYYRMKVNQIERQRQELKQEVTERTRELVSTNKRLFNAQKETERYATQTRLLYEVGQSISKELDLDSVLNAVVNSARDAFDYFGVMLLMKDEKRRGLILKSIAGGYKGVFPADLFIKIDEGMIGQAARTKETQLSNDVTKNPHYVRKAHEVTESELSIPIVSGKELIGVLDIQSDKTQAFDSSDVDVLETFSTQIASAIQNARLYAQAQREIADRKKAEDQLRSSRDSLAKAKKETDSIFRNVEEGLFLLNPQGKIGAQYSHSLENILGEKHLAAKSLIKLLENKIPQSTLNSAAEYLKIMFDDSIDETALEALNPLNEIELNISDGSGIWLESRYLMFKFKRISNRRGKTWDLIVTVKDITHQKRLAWQLEQTEADQKKQIEWMLSILHVEPALLREFMDGAKKELDFISKQLRTHNDVKNFVSLLQNTYRSMHLVKGNASLLDLKFFEKKAHQFEDKVAELQRLPAISGSHFVPLVIQLEDMRTTMKEIDKLIDRLGNIHNQFRPKREFETKLFIKSLQNLVNNLASDFNKEVRFETESFDPGLIPYEFRLTMKEILIQLIRNSIYHGLESAGERSAKGKQEQGTIMISATQENGSLLLIVRDDGRGLLLDQLREKARKMKKWDPAEIDSWDDTQLAQLIFESGISTADNVNLIAGRGMGMDAVKERIQHLQGNISVKFAENQFCQFEITIPLKEEVWKVKKTEDSVAS